MTDVVTEGRGIMVTKMCQMCGGEYTGKPRSIFCGECLKERHRARARRYMRLRKLRERYRPIKRKPPSTDNIECTLRRFTGDFEGWKKLMGY